MWLCCAACWGLMGVEWGIGSIIILVGMVEALSRVVLDNILQYNMFFCLLRVCYVTLLHESVHELQKDV